jgi:hypothetical protein
LDADVKKESKMVQVIWQRWIVVLFIVGVGLYTACLPSGEGQTPNQPVSPAFVLPTQDSLTSWEMATQAESYGPENLWEYINGQAEFFLDYGFVRVDAAEYRKTGGSTSVVVEAYQMGTPEEAFGIFAAERSPEDQSVAIGSGGYRGSNVLNFWQGSYYFKLTSFEGDADDQVLVDLGREMSRRNSTTAAQLPVFSFFPDQYRVESSERYFPRNFLGQPFLKRAYRVDYKRGEGERFQIFLAQLDTEEDAKLALSSYAHFMQSQGVGVEILEDKSRVVINGAYQNEVVFARDVFFGGVLNPESTEHGLRLAAELSEGIRNSAGRP